MRVPVYRVVKDGLYFCPGTLATNWQPTWSSDKKKAGQSDDRQTADHNVHKYGGEIEEDYRYYGKVLV